jgi:hypothetical protein
MKEHLKKSRGVVYAFFITFILLLLTSPLLSQPVVLDAKPTAKVESDANSTTRSVLSKPDQDKYRVRIAKQGSQYIWVSRENRELVHQSSGAVHYFIDPRGSGYVKFWTRSIFPNQPALRGRDMNTWSTSAYWSARLRTGVLRMCLSHEQ